MKDSCDAAHDMIDEVAHRFADGTIPTTRAEFGDCPESKLTESDQADGRLVKRVSTGDVLAFECLYDRVSTPLFSLAFYIVRSRTEAEDVLQDAFFQIWKRANTYRPERGCPFAWMASIVRHKAIDRLRARSFHAGKLELAWERRSAEPTAGETGASVAIQHEIRTEACEVLKKLSHDERRALELAYFGGLTHLQIAGALRQPVGTIKARIRRGLLKLRRFLREQERPWPSAA